MVKFFALFLAVIGLLLVGIGLALTHEHPAMLALCATGAAVTYFAYYMDRCREKSAAEQHAKAIKVRIETLGKTPWENGNFLEVKTSGANVFIALLAISASLLLAYSSGTATEPKWGVFVGGIFFSALVLFALIRILPGIGKPALILSMSGFQTPLYGIVQWSDVGGINLQQITIRGSTTNTLIFQVEDYVNRICSIHWTEQLLAFFGLGLLKRKVIPVLLNGASEDPEVVYAIARLLWQKDTNMNHEWNPLLSNELNQAARRAHEFMGRYKDQNASAEYILSNPDKALKEVEQFRQDMDTVNSERRHTISKINWMVAISILGIVATLLWPFLRNHI